MRRATLWSAALGVTVGLFALPAVADGPSVPGPYQPSCPIRGQFIPRADGWTQVQIPSGLAFLGGLSVRPDDERTLYANDHQSVYRSTDGGCHWASVFTLPAYVAPAPALPGQASGLEPAVIDSVHVAPRWDPRQAAPVWVTATLGSGSTGQSAVWYSPTGAGSFSSAGGGLAGHVRALVPVAQGAVALVDPAATLALPGAPASGEQVYIGTTRTVSGTSSTTWAPGGSTGLGRIDGIAADATAVPAVVYAWSG
ncbi:MAG TPA: hypothetical protein VNE21_00630, partial [Mycobacteriales bacterium]|nr:hypothetical protein [Mycobacteriales bacterium]